MSDWPKHPDGRPKKLGEMTLEEQREQFNAAGVPLPRELEQPKDQHGKMSVETACRWILGRDTANTIIADKGLKWAIVAAMAAATTSSNHDAVEALRQAQRNI